MHANTHSTEQCHIYLEIRHPTILTLWDITIFAEACPKALRVANTRYKVFAEKCHDPTQMTV